VFSHWGILFRSLVRTADGIPWGERVYTGYRGSFTLHTAFPSSCSFAPSCTYCTVICIRKQVSCLFNSSAAPWSLHGEIDNQAPFRLHPLPLIKFLKPLISSIFLNFPIFGAPPPPPTPAPGLSLIVHIRVPRDTVFYQKGWRAIAPSGFRIAAGICISNQPNSSIPASLGRILRLNTIQSINTTRVPVDHLEILPMARPKLSPPVIRQLIILCMSNSIVIKLGMTVWLTSDSNMSARGTCYLDFCLSILGGSFWSSILGIGGAGDTNSSSN